MRDISMDVLNLENEEKDVLDMMEMLRKTSLDVFVDQLSGNTQGVRKTYTIQKNCPRKPHQNSIDDMMAALLDDNHAEFNHDHPSTNSSDRFDMLPPSYYSQQTAEGNQIFEDDYLDPDEKQSYPQNRSRSPLGMLDLPIMPSPRRDAGACSRQRQTSACVQQNLGLGHDNQQIWASSSPIVNTNNRIYSNSTLKSSTNSWQRSESHDNLSGSQLSSFSTTSQSKYWHAPTQANFETGRTNANQCMKLVQQHQYQQQEQQKQQRPKQTRFQRALSMPGKMLAAKRGRTPSMDVVASFQRCQERFEKRQQSHSLAPYQITTTGHLPTPSTASHITSPSTSATGSEVSSSPMSDFSLSDNESEVYPHPCDNLQEPRIPSVTTHGPSASGGYNEMGGMSGTAAMAAAPAVAGGMPSVPICMVMVPETQRPPERQSSSGAGSNRIFTSADTSCGMVTTTTTTSADGRSLPKFGSMPGAAFFPLMIPMSMAMMPMMPGMRMPSFGGMGGYKCGRCGKPKAGHVCTNPPAPKEEKAAERKHKEEEEKKEDDEAVGVVYGRDIATQCDLAVTGNRGQ
jgi:hypothetical protein